MGVHDVGLLSPGWAGSAAERATGDAAWVQAMLDAEAALARAQAGLGHIPAAAAAAITACADVTRYDIRGIALRARAGGNPVIPLVADLTAAVAAGSSEAAGYVHRGATSQDILDTAAMLVADRALRPVVADLGRTAAALAGLALRHRRTPLPGRTLTQHAVPTTFGLKAAGWHQLVADAAARLAALLGGGLPAQLGGAAGTLAAFDGYARAAAGPGTAPPPFPVPPPPPVPPGTPAGTPGIAVLGAFAREVGLAEPVLPWHTLRTPVADLGASLAFTAGALGKLAADVLLMSRTEVAELAEPSGGGSSAMPHKANPVRATLIAAAARQLPVLASVLLASLVAEDERPAGAWHAEWQALREALRLVGGAAAGAAELAEGLRVDAARMTANLGCTGALIVSERLSVTLTPLLGRAGARRVAEDAACRAALEGRPFGQLLAEDPAVTKYLDAEQLAALLDPTTYTGSAAALVDRALGTRDAVAQDAVAQDADADTPTAREEQ